jgi:Lrp/AsnC family leucine-responsive transcriptional regulator
VDGRLANVDLAEAVSLSPSACLRRVKALEADGIIAGYRAEVDRIRAGLDLTVFIELRVEAAVPDLASYEHLLLDQIQTIPSIVSARSMFAIRTVLSRGPLPVEHWR